MRIKRVSFIFFALLGVLLFGFTAQAIVPYQSYTYDTWKNSIPASQAYVPTKVIRGLDLGVGDFRSPRDLCVDGDDNIYILDSGNNRIIILDSDFQFLAEIVDFENFGWIDEFANPYGIYVTEKKEMFIADSENERVLKLTTDGELLEVFDRPKSAIPGVIPDDFVYRPRKVGVDPSGRIFVIARDVYEGLMSFDANGNFQGFIGAPKVAPKLADIFWSKIATKAQRSRRTLFLPTEFSNLDIDNRGFILTTISSDRRMDVVMRLNPAGTDVIRREGYFPPRGDIPREEPENLDEAEARTAKASGSLLTDITARSFDGYTVLDRNKGKVFTYDEDGNFLYVFGRNGQQTGTFQDAVAVTVLKDERILVLDNGLNSITVFEPTEYGRAIHAAIHHYNLGNYDESTEMWDRVLRMNVNYELAYGGIGRSHFMQQEYAEAMKAFRLANDRDNYSKAFRNYRQILIEKNFGWVALIIVVLLVLIFYKTRRQASVGPRPDYRDYSKTSKFSRLWDSLKYALHLVIHPFDGFWDLKHEKRGNVPAASIILFLACLSYLANRQYTGFIFNPRNTLEMNIYIEVGSILVPFFLFNMVNWAATTLMGGKGTWRDIYITTAYALTPLVLILIPATIISNYLILEEGAFFQLLTFVSVAWSIGLIFVGTMVIHDYSAGKNIVTSLISIVGIGMVIFGIMFGFSIIAQLSGFLMDVYQEVIFRL